METTTSWAEVLFLASGLLVLYTYFLFPALLAVRAVLFPRPFRRGDATPSISLVIVAHNEARAIGAKLENVLAQDYPAERLEVIVASDGSDDGTDAIVAGYSPAASPVRLLACPRRGKIPALNDAVATAVGEVLVFSDANSMLQPGALKALVRPFADPSVGAVAGNQRYTGGSGNTASRGERLYWSFDRLLKQLQNRAGNVTSATGALHAIRRPLFQPVPKGVGDDFVISTRAIGQGYRLVFEADAAACEPPAETDRSEFRRKVRVIVRGLHGLWVVRELFNPLRHGFYALQIFSHKLLRWSVPWLLLVLLVTSALLCLSGPLFYAVFVAQVSVYAIAVLALPVKGIAPDWLRKLLALPYYFALANCAALCAWLKVLAGTQLDVWDSHRTPRHRTGLRPASGATNCGGVSGEG